MKGEEPYASDSILRGTVQRITFRNPSNGYTVLQVKSPESVEPVTVVGTAAEVHVGSSIIARGTYVVHKKFGRQLQAGHISVAAPSDSESLVRYLSSGVVEGIGPKTAQKIVEEFGEDALEIIFQTPERLTTLRGISPRKAKHIHEKLMEERTLKEVIRFLMQFHVTAGLASRIYQRYKAQSIDIVKADPYVLARELRGVGFATADSIALNLGLAPDSSERIRAGVHFALEKGAEDGHCFLPIETLRTKTAALLGLDEGELDLREAVRELEELSVIAIEDERVYLRELATAEWFVSEFVARRCQPFPIPLLEREKVEAALCAAMKALDIQFSVEQRQAVFDASRFPLLLITGGPGCGKTTVIRALVSAFRFAKREVALAAPTGRAAQRMAQVCDAPAKTIHRLLRYNPLERGFEHGPNFPLEQNGKPIDVLIIDETSMLDIELAHSLFSAIPKSATVILVGDKDQLPSVGPGRVFADLLSIPEVPKISLNQLFRRAQQSTITTLAHGINAGLPPEIPEPDGNTQSDAYFIARESAEDAAVTIESLVADQLPRKFGFSQDDITVITPSNRGALGVQALNLALQRRINPNAGDETTTVHSNKMFSFYLGDKVCQRVNNYSIDSGGVFNGETGVISDILDGDEFVVEFWDGRLVKYDAQSASQLSLAYAITVHRSQGSEIPCVILAVHESHYTLLERQLIYTGITRAKKLLVVVGSRKALQIATRRATSKHRCSSLAQLIHGAVNSDSGPSLHFQDER